MLWRYEMADWNPIRWIEIPVADLKRASLFYGAVFEFELEPIEMGPMKMAMFPHSEGHEGASGALMQSEYSVPSKRGSLVYFGTDDIERTLGRVEAKGGKIIKPKTAIGQYGYFAVFEDTEGNAVALHSMA
jgi:hypothetical protein